MMRCVTTVADPLKVSAPALVVGCFADVDRDPLLASLDQALGGVIDELVRQREFTAKPNRTRLIHTLGRLPAERLLLVGLGMRREFSAERLRQAAGAAVQALRGAGCNRFATVLHHADPSLPRPIRAVVEGTLLGGYTFRHYKTDPQESAELAELTIVVASTAAATMAEAEAQEAAIVGEAVCLARDLVSQPGNVATPAYLADRAREIAGRWGLDCQVLEREEIEHLGMNALLAVGKGSHQPPRFIVLEYHGGKPGGRPTVLIGKGVTFDSGGISLKPREGMERMKDDMAGGAAVLATLQAAAALKLSVNLVGLLPAAENLPGGGAYKPGDVVRAMSGKTIEIVNTDAEGRLLLCDALHYARRYRPAAIIDLATLTGACLVALGSFASGLLGNSERLARHLRKAGEATGERLWDLPLWDQYGEQMESDIADLKNAGGPHAGTITAAWFLKQFVGTTPWAHLDIAGTAWEEKGRPYLPKGATGVGVRLLVEYLENLR